MKVPLDQTAVVTLNGSGGGTAKVGPLSAREVWFPANVHVRVSTTTSEAQCLVYVGGDAIQVNFRDGTFTGSSGDSSDRVNADTLTVTGTKQV
jgi:hypothetical protein